MLIRRMPAGPLSWAAVVLALMVNADAMGATTRPDIVVADFEGSDYGTWVVEGEAFGPGPAQGTLAGQMQVSGFLGHGLVNTFFNGDGTTGKLTSAPFVLDRTYLRFLMGGGQYPGEACMNLLVDGEIVDTATGPNDRPGGNERLAWRTWNISALAGRTAVLEIIDTRTGGWGHINVDHIVMSDTPIEELTSMKLTVTRRYLNIPVKTGAPKHHVTLSIDGKDVRISNVEITTEPPDFWAPIDLASYQGCEVTIRTDSAEPAPRLLQGITQDDTVKGEANVYSEPLRPQFHFSQKRGWNNDPNGMVFYAGEWHLFFQHNPYGWGWDNMHWGHAVSRDLVHWEELPIALYPWTMAKEHCFSGSAVVDWRNSAGFQTGQEKALVAAFTDTGCGESLAFSNDRGRTWTYWEANPVVKHQGRDPKLLWHAPTQTWVMAVYDEQGEGDATTRHIAFYNSPDLKQWEFQSRIEGWFECPELFELSVDGGDTSRWVLLAADAQYAIGHFDGATFTPEHTGKQRLHWGRYYASQTFSDAPGVKGGLAPDVPMADQRRIQIGWAQVEMKGMAFNQTMSFPSELSLRTTPDGIRLVGRPVKELETLHRGVQAGPLGRLADAATPALQASSGLCRIRAEFAPAGAAAFGLTVGPDRFTYQVAENRLGEIPLPLSDGKIRFDVLVDRSLVEVFANDGRAVLTQPFAGHGAAVSVSAFSEGGAVEITRFEVTELAGTWPVPTP